MSCDWNIHCLDCDVTHTFNDANHMVAEMRALIKHAKAIGALEGLKKDLGGVWGLEFNLGSRGPIDPSWFAEHAGHRLIPRDEYLGFDDECGERFHCKACGDQKTCHLLKGHEGECAEKRP